MLVDIHLLSISASAELEPGSNIEALVALVVTLIVLFPVVNKGLPLILDLEYVKRILNLLLHH